MNSVHVIASTEKALTYPLTVFDWLAHESSAICMLAFLRSISLGSAPLYTKSKTGSTGQSKTSMTNCYQLPIRKDHSSWKFWVLAPGEACSLCIALAILSSLYQIMIFPQHGSDNWLYHTQIKPYISRIENQAKQKFLVYVLLWAFIKKLIFGVFVHTKLLEVSLQC